MMRNNLPTSANIYTANIHDDEYIHDYEYTHDEYYMISIIYVICQGGKGLV